MKPLLLLSVLTTSLLACTPDGVHCFTLESLTNPQIPGTIITAAANQSISICDTISGQCQPFTPKGLFPSFNSSDKIILWASLIRAVDISLRNPSPQSCANPCEIDANMSWGDVIVEAEEVNSSGVSYNPIKGTGEVHIPMIPVAPAASITFPQYIVGQENYRQAYQVIIPAGAPTTGCSIYERVSNHTYQQLTDAGMATGGIHKPWDGKMSFRIWNGLTQSTAGSWINVNNTTSTAQDFWGRVGIDGIHSIAGPVNTIEISFPIPDNSFTANSTVVFENRFNGTDGVTSGYDIHYQFLVCSAPVQLASISVLSNVATGNPLSGTNTFASGSDIYITFAPGYHGRFNGPRHVTTSTGSTFSFTPCGSGPGFYFTTVSGVSQCASPNGTYAVPISTANSNLLSYASQTAQVAMYAVQIVAPALLSITYDDPSTYTSGPGNSTTGHTLFTTRDSLLVSNGAEGGWKIHASCADCHAGNAGLTNGMVNEGWDLKGFNASNQSIKQRSIFHGLTGTQGDHIVAYIRSISTPVTNPDARLWNPPYQPGPGLDSNPVSYWYAGAGVDAVSTYDATDSWECMGSATTTWTLTQTVNWRQTCSPLQYVDWLHWLTPVHPADSRGLKNCITVDINENCLTTSNGMSGWWSDPNIVQADYNSLVTNLAPMTDGAYTGQLTALAQWLDTSGDLLGTYTGAGLCVKPLNDIGNCVDPGTAAKRRAGYKQWQTTKEFELMHPILEGKGDVMMTALFGSRASGNYDPRSWYQSHRDIFNQGSHITNDFSQTYGFGSGYLYPIVYIQDGIIGTYPTYASANANNSGFVYQTAQWYSITEILHAGGNFKAHTSATNGIVDENYVWNFFADVGMRIPCVIYCVYSNEIFFNQGSQDIAPAQTVTGGDQSTMMYNAAPLFNFNTAIGYSWLTSARITQLFSYLVQQWHAQLNAWSPTVWNAAVGGSSTYSTCGNTATSNLFNGGEMGGGCTAICIDISALLAYGKYFGVAGSDLDNLVTDVNTLSCGGFGRDFKTDRYANGGLNVCTVAFCTPYNTWWPFFSNMSTDYMWTSRTTLAAGITSGQTTGIQLADCTFITAFSTINISGDYIGVTSASSGILGTAGACTVNVIRDFSIPTAVGPQTPASHSMGATVSN